MLKIHNRKENMADIYTHLRELGVAFSFYCSRPIDEITPKYFFETCCKNIKMTANIDISRIANNPEMFNAKELEIINNSIKLGKAIKENFNLPPHPEITWVGCFTQSDSPIDLIIDKYKFSLKEESFILENMGLYKLLNLLLSSNKYATGTHVFKEFAPAEFENWFNVTCNCLLKYGPYDFSIERVGKYNAEGIIEKNGMFLRFNETESVRFNDIRSLSYEEFKTRTNSHLREYVFSKWIKNTVENKDEYIKAKKYCAQQAGNNILHLVRNCKNTCPDSLLRFFRIEDEEYYYAKTTNHSLEIYKVPSKKNACKNILIKEIWTEVPSSQLNFYTKIINTQNGCEIVFRNELRYSHGQFNGTPEAKCYIDRNNCNLTTMYEKILYDTDCQS